MSYILVQMQFVKYKTGGAENLEIGTTDLPGLRNGEILMKVYATAINRADILQVAINTMRFSIIWSSFYYCPLFQISADCCNILLYWNLC